MVRRNFAVAVACVAALNLSGCIFVADHDHDSDGYYSSSLGDEPARHDSINDTLDALHDAASKAQEDRYFRLFSDNAIFLGTDATERWTKEQFRAYAHERFSQGKGWTYTVARRNIFLSHDRRTAWFDEELNNEKYGPCRGTGVLVREDGHWKIAQYNLTIPVPNDLAETVVKMIREQRPKS